MTLTPRFVLQREPADPERTFGEWRWARTGERIVYTLEPGTADPFRLPAGFYHGVPHEWQAGSTADYPQTWALVGESCSHQAEPGVAHCACLLHWGNWDRNTRGCVLCGLARGMLAGEPAILSSKPAIAKLRGLIGNRDFYVTIRDAS